jgi:hypothetical protein
MRSVLRLSVAMLLCVLGLQSAYGAGIFLGTAFRLHDFDTAILASLGYDAASVIYLREIASITPDQLKQRNTYETIGCNPFSVVKDSLVQEAGYNCQTFFCVGYIKGPKRCMDTDGKAYGGVVEMDRRLGEVTINEAHLPFTDLVPSLQTPAMKQKVAALASAACVPFYLMRFDVAVGEGYDCEELGSYPQYSAKRSCLTDWRDKQPVKVCDVPERSDEMAIRQKLMVMLGRAVASSSAASSAQTVSSLPPVTSSSSVAPAYTVFFPDVIEGKYGYTAIMTLAGRGILKGYPSGKFLPQQTINRAEFVKVLVSGLHAAEVRGETGCFRDVHDEWYAPYVCAAKRLGWVSGYADGTFRPTQTLKREELLKIVVASVAPSLESVSPLPPDVDASSWFAPYARKAMELKLILEPRFYPGQNAYRADAAVWIYRASKAQ